ncbi:predicted protein [Sclerotinia sclerotiorum 1980 UF-70]|uniref:Uncharacterized protein n=2 Tax=Sclerotinia sclerotiorum (strain ATCC 18683 / 1980 / Ss-1) TaxID=665079 RepID=A7EJD5_SCLS1|nr:predicted protein [Sclerotinia sclerotiorum 1980 UF-70]APA11898.1 hypothetical protein sscle_08g066680 [Sclerotinia sclerotiorum 1980 UF-70]EDO02951.1 predicted protein [Sclerotinia sclerotiorum 1980 UF-70]
MTREIPGGFTCVEEDHGNFTEMRWDAFWDNVSDALVCQHSTRYARLRLIAR